MTRDEFLEDCTCMDDIARICSEYDYYDLIEDYRNEDTIEDWIDYCYLRSIEGYSWRDVLDDLANFQSTLESYRWFYIGDYTVDGVEDRGGYFDRLKADLFMQLVEDGYIDDEEEEEPEEVDGFAVEEEISIFEAVEEGSHIQTISTEECDETEEISILF